VVDEASPPEGLPDRAGSIDGLSGAKALNRSAIIC
jgi:hypothetical protein